MKLFYSAIITIIAASSPVYSFNLVGPQRTNIAQKGDVKSYSLPLQASSRKVHHSSTSSSSRSITSLFSSVSTGADGKEVDIIEEVDAIFDCIDINKDGTVSAEELRSHLVDKMGYTETYTKYLFDTLDMDSDGEITREEMKYSFYNFEALSMYMTFGVGGREVTSRDAFKKLARGNTGEFRDGKLLLNDMADLIFEMIDTDSSGTIDKDELADHFEKVTQKFAEGSTDSQAKEYVQSMFATLDTDENGVIEKQEMRDAFQLYDFKILVKTFGLSVYRTN